MEVHEGDAEVLSDGQVASDGDEGPGHSPIPNTLSGVNHVFRVHEETDVGSDHELKIPSAWWKWHQPSHSAGVPGGQHARENYQHLCGTCGPPS